MLTATENTYVHVIIALSGAVLVVSQVDGGWRSLRRHALLLRLRGPGVEEGLQRPGDPHRDQPRLLHHRQAAAGPILTLPFLSYFKSFFQSPK